MVFAGKVTDPTYSKDIKYNSLDKFFISFLKDKRDLPFIYLTLKITFTLIPLAIIMFYPGTPNWLWWTAAIIYLYLNIIELKGPFGLMMHCTSHRPWFKNKYSIANEYLPWFLGLFFGQTPKTYFSHHIGMHHIEGNLMPDKSTTMPYQRDSALAFARYFFDFLLVGILKVSLYFKSKKRFKLMWWVVRGELFFYTMIAILFYYNWQATLVVFISSFFVSRIVMMIGNWTQHAFIDPEDPGHGLKNSLTCINVPFNHRCWNDGYHASHHMASSMHWSEHPTYFLEHINEFRDCKAVVFDGLDFGAVWKSLMIKDYKKLAKHFVNLDNQFKSEEEIIAFLKSRTKAIPPA